MDIRCSEVWHLKPKRERQAEATHDKSKQEEEKTHPSALLHMNISVSPGVHMVSRDLWNLLSCHPETAPAIDSNGPFPIQESTQYFLENPNQYYI
jgi:hypothetical protein